MSLRLPKTKASVIASTQPRYRRRGYQPPGTEQAPPAPEPRMAPPAPPTTTRVGSGGQGDPRYHYFIVGVRQTGLSREKVIIQGRRMLRRLQVIFGPDTKMWTADFGGDDPYLGQPLEPLEN